jgi:hypothetical protein
VFFVPGFFVFTGNVEFRRNENQGADFAFEVFTDFVTEEEFVFNRIAERATDIFLTR